MWSTFKEWYRKNVNDRLENKIDNALVFKNRQVEICGNHYFLGKGTLTDLPDIVKVSRAAGRGHFKWSRKRFQLGLRNDHDRFYFILRYHDELVGFIDAVIKRDQRLCIIDSLAILPEFQHHGLGYFLITTCIERAREMELQQVLVCCSDDDDKTQGILTDLGFVTKEEAKQDRAETGLTEFQLNLEKRNVLASKNFGR
ncbi:Acetyltransferase [Fructilactobacillus florum 8D]|uniref:Acetyltransferase n=1 Tax=Fructilactobacillus florum 8D TaxID=1221538 RepID=W9EH00_9LACO|nr:GNAT family N-acetyltransferase [Fructilactobacillus florum]EKK20029.1 Acetyltransferase [Fructilactobacillus florum 2F]ETO40295.1 Acetyltransferase [Fructilactobacillus florum 8D]